MSVSRSSDDRRGPDDEELDADSRAGFDEESAGGVVLRRIEGELHVLLILDPYGKWGLPKGHLEGDEGPVEAAHREVREETGLEDVSGGLEVDTITWSFRKEGEEVQKICTFYLMCSDVGEIRPEVSEGITDCAWLSVEDAVRRVDYENTRDVIRKAERMWVEETTPAGADVPGGDG